MILLFVLLFFVLPFLRFFSILVYFLFSINIPHINLNQKGGDAQFPSSRAQHQDLSDLVASLPPPYLWGLARWVRSAVASCSGRVLQSRSDAT